MKYLIDVVGSKAKVLHGNAQHTSGGLHKRDLKKNKRGHIVSIKQSNAGKIAFRRNGLRKKTKFEMDQMRP